MFVVICLQLEVASGDELLDKANEKNAKLITACCSSHSTAYRFIAPFCYLTGCQENNAKIAHFCKI